MPLRALALTLLLALIPFFDSPRAQPLSTEAYTALAEDLVFGDPARAGNALTRLTERGRFDAAASMILALRYNRTLGRERIGAALRAITGADVDDTWFDWMLWQQSNPQITPHPGHFAVQRRLFAEIDPRFLQFLPPAVEHRIRLEEIVWGGVVVDGIPALTNPHQLRADQARYLNPEDAVFGVEINGDARAYPLRILNWHEMFNDVIGGVPVSLAYCTLCGAGILFETTAAGRAAPFVFGSSGFLYRSNKLMYDQQTRSLWNQFTGEPVVGPLVGSGIALDILPVTITTWADWRAAHPETSVIDIATGFRRDYRPGAAYGAYFASDALMFPAALGDKALTAKEQIFGIRLPGGAKAWPLAAFTGGAVINDAVGFSDVVLLGSAATRTVRAYERMPNERFARDASGALRREDGAQFTVTEAALLGPDGARRERVPGHVAYWFAWAGYLGEGAELYQATR